MTTAQRDRAALAASRAVLIVAGALLWGCAAQSSPAGVGPPQNVAASVTGDIARRTVVPTSELEQPSPLGRDWIFTQVDGFDGPLPSPPPVAGFIMTREGRRLTGTTACNRMGSAYELDPSVGRLRFVDLRNTRMLCDRIAADTEEAVLEAMIATDAFRIVDGRLELLSNGKVVAHLISP
ncbi:MAG: META domain-containing protein [Candidatus Binatia bacterium]